MERILRFFYGIVNLRSLDLPFTELHPITVLVGRNNSGKSSLLRAFPLLKQSVEDNVEGPISWRGNLVDFGNFESAVKKNCGEEGITFSFKIENIPFWIPDLNREKSAIGQKIYMNKIVSGNVEVIISVKQLGQKVIKRETQIHLNEPEVQLSIKSDVNGKSENIKLNNKDDLILDKKFLFKFEQDCILSKFSPEYIGDLQELSFDKFGLRNLMAIQLGNYLLEEISIDNIAMKEIESEVLKILENIVIDKRTLLKLEKCATSKVFKDYYQNVRKERLDILNKLNEICGLFWSYSMHNEVCKIFDSIMKNSVYFRPTRGRDERYFGSINLDKMEILSKGENLSGFYESLDREQLSEFSDWVQKFFGFTVSIDKANGHTSIFINEFGENFNLADSGFGISEILPFLTQIWWELQKILYSEDRLNIESLIGSKGILGLGGYLKLPKLIAIEQPELHLHPAHQAKIADVLVNAIKLGENENTEKPNFIIETHSQSFINRLGQLIRQGEISESDINVLVFSKRFENSQIKYDIQNSYYDSEGILRNWPYGFFRYST